MSLTASKTSDVPQRIAIEELMQGKSELQIIHNEQQYTLRITRNGKLILTK